MQSDIERALTEWEPFLKKLVRATVYRADDREDALQTARLVFIEQYPKFPGGNLEGWLSTIIRRALVRPYSREARRREILTRQPVAGRAHRAETVEEVPDADFRGEAEQRLFCAELLEGLTRDRAQVIRLYYLKQLTYREIAERCSIPINTVKSRLHRAKRDIVRLTGTRS